MADKGHYQKAGGSRQGIYVCSPGGVLLSSVNSLNPEVVLETIQTGLNKWEDLSDSDRHLPADFSPKAQHRWEDSYPSDGLVLKGAKADLLSDPPQFSNRGDRWNMDHVWFNNNESKMWLPEKIQKGQIHELPDIIKHRLFRFHLVDNVRGQTLPFAPQEIKKSALTSEVLNISNTEIDLKISGDSYAVAKGPWLLGENDWTPTRELDHSININLIGQATYNITKELFTEFELVAIGRWIGKTENNGRNWGPDSGKIGIYYQLGVDSPIDRIAPAFVDLYNADWIKQPEE